MSNILKKLSIYGFSALIGLTSLFGGFKYEPNTLQITNPTQVEQVVKGSKLENIAKSFKFGPAAAYAKEIGQYQAPTKVEGKDAYVLDGKEYAFDKTFKVDVEKDGVKESDARLYKNSAGDKIFSISTNGRLWAWVISDHDSKNNVKDITKNYTLRDSKCSGIFDEKYGNEENFGIPTCINK